MNIIILILILWFGLGLLGSGYAYSLDKRKWEWAINSYPDLKKSFDRSDRIFSLIVILSGLSGLLATIIIHLIKGEKMKNWRLK